LMQADKSAVKTIDVSYLNQAVQLFNTQEGHLPKDLNELVPNYVAKLPAAPYGYKIVYDATSGAGTGAGSKVIPAELLLYHRDRSAGRVIYDFIAEGRGGKLGHVIRNQFVQILGQTSFLRIEQLDGLVEIRNINSLDCGFVRLHQRAQITSRRRGGGGIGGWHRVRALGPRTGAVLPATGQKQPGCDQNQIG
jgi:hypothetical protein